jgi:hypothetical protein
LHFVENMDSRGSLAWFGRQTHNLESVLEKGPRPEVASSNPAPGTTEISMDEKLKKKEEQTSIRFFVCAGPKKRK